MHNRRLAQWRMTWLIEHSTSHQLLYKIEDLCFDCPTFGKPKNVVLHIRETRNEQEIQNDLHTTDIDTELFLC
jgi:hypothetical protein